jgi:hypothetical protein
MTEEVLTAAIRTKSVPASQSFRFRRLSAMEILREWERAALPAPRPRVGVEVMAGRWTRTNDKPQWIGGLDIRADGDDLLVRVAGGGAGPSPADWGIVRTATVYGGWLTSGDAAAGAFVAHYEFPDAHVEMQANLNLGLLVVATFVDFKSPGSSANRFTREFFFRA